MSDPIQFWLQTKIGAAVQAHIASGLKVFPLHGVKDDLTCTCGKADCGKNTCKHPYAKTAPNGFLNATHDIEIAAEMFEYRSDLNIGVATGKDSGIIVLDIDDKNNGSISLDKLQEVMGILPSTMRLRTGNGWHYIFDYPGYHLKSGTNVFGKEAYPGIDLRADGGYIVIYPSRHQSGRYYEADSETTYIGDLPRMYLDYLKAEKKHEEKPVDRDNRSGNISEWSEADIESMLEYLDPNMDYHDWIAVGMALHKEGCPIGMWDNWSSRGHKYKGIGDVNKHWRSFNANGDRTIGTLVEWAMLQGWKPPHREYYRNVDEVVVKAVDPYIQRIKERLQKKPEAINKPLIIEPEPSINHHRDVGAETPKVSSSVVSINGNHAAIPPVETLIEVGQFSFDPMKLSGPIGETVRWITKYAIYEQPELALMNVLAFAGAVFGRKYKSPLDTRTNIYMVGIADTGAGKDHSRKMINRLSMHAKLDTMIGGNAIRSDTGMLRGLMNNSSQLLMLDEFGLLMQALSDPKAPHHIRMISKAMMSLYSDSNSVYNHGDYADEKAKPIKIICPNLCIYGTTTQSSYLPSLRKSAIESGELNRFIVIPSTQTLDPKRHIPEEGDHAALYEWWNQFSPTAKSSLGTLVNSATIVPAAKEVRWGECEDLRFELLKEQTGLCTSADPLRALWSRLYENTIKIAMIFAIARNPDDPEFIEEDFRFAYSMVRYSIEYMMSLADLGMAETPHEANLNEVTRAIQSFGIDGVPRSFLFRKLRKYRKKELDEIIGGMLEDGSIIAERATHGIGRQAIYYKMIANG